MPLVCLHCRRVLEYSGDRPSFCGYCGQPLPAAAETSDAKTVAPSVEDPWRTVAGPPLETKGDDEVEDPARTATGPPAPAGAQPSEAGDFPESVGGYRLLRQIGRGGMGAVFAAQDSTSGRHVALKLIAPHFIASAEAVERFRQEGRLASTIAHPRCVFVLAADEDAGQPFIVMELMPGSTLKDLVAGEGPLSWARAVTLILDVIEGLEEAHQHGVIHRDVKPSNCFLEADGRVKIGDFGLSKSLTSDAHLTMTGTFLGTPLFAAPEQLRGEAMDARTDVYAVAATLYYLLIGRAPFEGGDPTSILVRVISDPAPPMRGLRPEMPAALDRVVLRGLERLRERRWQNLDEFRLALLPFVPGQLSFAGLGIRLGAYLLDFLVLAPGNWAIVFLVLWINVHWPAVAASWSGKLLAVIPGFLYGGLYFGLLEGIWGCSLGKRWLRLRVCGPEGPQPPGLAKGFVRAFFFLLISGGPAALGGFWLSPEDVAASPSLTFLPMILSILGMGLILSTMRARNGFRGLHEWLSDTRITQLLWRRQRKPYQQGNWEHRLTRPDDLPQQMGPFEIQGALRWSEEEKVLLGVDRALGRKVVLWLRPAAQAALGEVRRDLARVTRSRWLKGGQEGAMQWDAFLAPTGCPLPEVVAATGNWSWTETSPVLEDLADELAAAIEQGDLPESLSLDQVCVQPNGRIQLLDFSPRGAAEPRREKSAQEAALALLGHASALVLEGQPRAGGDSCQAFRAPLPLHVERFLPRLLGAPEPYQEVKQFQIDLQATRQRPTEVRGPRRLVHLLLLSWLVLCSCCCLGPALFLPPPKVKYLDLLASDMRKIESIQARLEAEASYLLLGNLVQPDPLLRLQGVVQWQEDMALSGQLQHQRADFQQEYEAWRKTLSFFENWRVDLFKGQGALQLAKQSKSGNFRQEAEQMLALEVRSQLDPLPRTLAAGAILWAIFLAVWVVWALFSRGGISYRLTGLRLVRADGRKPGRWQCAARALLFWLPVLVLLAGSLGLDCWFCSLRDPQPGGLLDFLPMLSTAAWFAGLLVLPFYAALALWSPTRGPHDRLVGTCLVPR